MVAKDRITDLTNNCYKNAKIITNWAVIGLFVSLTYANEQKRCACYLML